MLFTVSLITSLLLALAVLAYPYHDEHPHLLTRENDESILWAGAEYYGDGQQGAYASINATFNVPHVEHLEYPFSVKIGLDNIHCRNAYIQTGVEITPDHNVSGKPSYRAYFLWYPSNRGYFEQLSVSAGQDITFSIEVTLTPTTFAVITAEHANKSDIVILSTSSANAICAEDAALLVQPDDHNKPIANFGTVVFKNITLPVVNQHSFHLKDLVQNFKQTATATLEPNFIVVSYV